MGKAPAFQFYASDFKMDTESWTVVETGIYIRLLMNQWVNKELPVEPSRLARIAGCDVRTFNRNWQDTIAKKFAVGATGGLQNYKLESIRKERTEFIEGAVESGRLGGLKTQKNRRNKASDPSSKPSSENKALQSSTSSSSSKEKITPHMSQTSLTLSALLFEGIKANNEKSKFNNLTGIQPELQIQKWAIDIDRMIRIDKRTEQDIKEVIKFATEDMCFWHSNIQSGGKLRKQFDKLYVTMKTPKKEDIYI